MHIEIIIPRRGINDDGLGKKHALAKLINASQADYVWLQDDDIVPPPATGEELTEYLHNTDLLILPLRMESENQYPSLLERLQIAEYAAIQQLTVESALYAHPVMCSSANMIVRRQAWLESYNDLHLSICSGDDMFLLESFKRRGLTIAVADTHRLTAVVRPLTSFRAFFKQRMRWAGKAPHYTDRDILRCGWYITIANLLQILCPLVLLIKFPVEYRLIKKRDPDISFGIAFLLELLYPWYMLVSLIGGLFRRQW